MSKAGAYYNEIDPKSAAWLRELVKRGHIADGEVDERSIVDVAPDDLRGFTQCHFFAGIGIWSYALRGAGWADDRPVWTGSCPCQPFSAAGARGGIADERHLWPAFHHLIDQCRPPVVFGEQVASKDGLGWLDLVQADLEGAGYASGASDTCAAGFGAPHIRQRLWFVGLEHSIGDGSQGRVRGGPDTGRAAIDGSAGRNGATDDLAGWHPVTFAADCDPEGDGWCCVRDIDPAECDCIGPTEDDVEYREIEGTLYGRRLEHATGDGRVERRAEPSGRGVAGGRGDGGLADAHGAGAECWTGDDGEAARLQEGQREPIDGTDVSERSGADHDGRGDVRGDGLPSDARRPGPTNGLWRDADWLFCRDGKWRPVEPGTFPLAHGSAARVGRLRGYGNAIAAPAAQAFIESVMEISNV